MENNHKLSYETTPRPTSITVLIVLLFIQAVGTLGYGIFLGYSRGWTIFKGERFLNFLPFAMADHVTSGVVLISISVFMFIVVLSFIRQKPWAWLAAMTIQGLSLIVGLVEYLIDNPNYVALAFGVVLVFYLNLQEVRDTFYPKQT
ncbi:MAG: hypothetical protein GYA34_17140 [Chloroflexi bacterium]|nr:hypothetical protein [Chloroflexota bacterium]